MPYPSPRLHPDPAPDPAPARGDWRLVAWLPVVFGVALIRWLRWHLCGWLYRAGDAANPAPPMTDERADAMEARMMRAVEAEAARERGGAT